MYKWWNSLNPKNKKSYWQYLETKHGLYPEGYVESTISEDDDFGICFKSFGFNPVIRQQLRDIHKSKPIRAFFLIDLPDFIFYEFFGARFLFYWYRDLKYYIKCRLRQSHLLTTGLKAGCDYSLENKVTSALFSNYITWYETYKESIHECRGHNKKTLNKIVELYDAIKARDFRIDPYHYENEQGTTYAEIYGEVDAVEAKYFKEDTHLLLDLIKLREHIW